MKCFHTFISQGRFPCIAGDHIFGCDVHPCFRRSCVVRICESKILECQAGIVVFAQLFLGKAEIKSCINSLLGNRIKRNECTKLFDSKIVHLIVIKINGKLKIGILLRILSGRRSEKKKGKKDKKQYSLHL